MSQKVKENTVKNKGMFTIDLLKGQGIPPKSGPAGITIALITAIVPAVIALSLYGLHLNNKVVTKIRQQDILKLEAKTSELSGAVEMKKALEKKKVLYKECLSEVRSSIGKFTQWSPVLTTLVEEMPASVILTDLTVEQDSVEKEVPKKDNPQKKVKINVPVTKLVLHVSNQGKGDCREEVKDFRDRLYASSVLGSKLEDIAFSRKTKEGEEGKETVSYQIECMLKPE